MLKSQLASKNAWVASQRAAFNAFKAQLGADEALYDAQQLRTFFGGIQKMSR